MRKGSRRPASSTRDAPETPQAARVWPQGTARAVRRRSRLEALPARGDLRARGPADGNRVGARAARAEARVPAGSTAGESSGGGTRTPDTRIMIPLL